MGNIVLLDDLTINKIAAGEVIERPASVVKEMVENSIDAGANNITVEIRNGGISYIKITDNGKGILPDDLEIAFERHATSKIRSADDLKTVKSMGFRGEALASIAAISNVEMISKTESQDVGYKIVVEAGNVLEKQEIGCPTGTSITVKNLFFNTPVRYKFLKKDFTESGYIEDVITRIALVNPNVAIKLINTGKTVIQTNGNGDLKTVIYSIYGKDVAQNVLPVDYDYEDIKISGVIGKPEISRSNRSNQIFFVNKRYVKDKIFSSATEQAYKGLLPIGKFAFVVLNITIDPAKVDVNVHPAKLEVRFSDENKIYKAIYHAIKDRLLKDQVVEGDPLKKDQNFGNGGPINTADILKQLQDLKKSIENDEIEEHGLKYQIENKEIANSENKVEDTNENYFANKQEVTNEKIENSETEKFEIEKFNEIGNNEVEKLEIENEIGNNEAEKFEIENEKNEIENLNEIGNNEAEKFEIETGKNEIEKLNEIRNNETKKSEIENREIVNKNKDEFSLPENEEQKQIISDAEKNQTAEGEEQKQITLDAEENQTTENQAIENEERETNEEKPDFDEMYQKLFGVSPKDFENISSTNENNKFENDSFTYSNYSEEKNSTDLKNAENVSIFENDETIKNTELYKFIGTAFDRYVVIEWKNALYLIDSYVASQKLIYDEFQTNYLHQNRNAQNLFLPDVVTFDKKQMNIYSENKEMIEMEGFKLEPFGDDNTMKLTEVPSSCFKLDTKELLLDILNGIGSIAITDIDAKEKKSLEIISKKLEISQRKELNAESAKELVENLLKKSNNFEDLNGKPIALIMAKGEIERKFARK